MNKSRYILYIIYKMVFDWIYIDIVSENFNYMGLYKDFNISKYMVGWLIFVIYITIIGKIIKKDIILYIVDLFIIFSFLPQISLWGIKNYKNEAIILMILYWTIFIIFFNILNKINFNKSKNIISKYDFKKYILSNRIYIIFILIFSICVIIYVSGKYSGFRFTLSFDDVYSYRESYNAMSKSALIGYLLPLTCTVLLPYVFMVYLIEEKYMISFIIAIVGVLSFSISGMKTWICIYLAVLFLCLFGKKKINLINCFLVVLIIFSLLSGFVYYKNGIIDLVGYHNRILSYPSELNYYYYNFFKNNELLYLRESFMRHFFTSPYQISTPFLIGNLYGGGGYSNNAVNGLFGDSYANFGIIGVIIYPIILAAIMKRLIVLCNFYKDNRYLYCISFILIWNSLNTSFFTWIITGGVFLFLFIIYINRMGKSFALKMKL